MHQQKVQIQQKHFDAKLCWGKKSLKTDSLFF